MNTLSLTQEINIGEARQEVSTPRWSTFDDYERSTDEGGHGFIVFDTATIINKPPATVSMERQTAVGPDGSIGWTLESLKLSVGGEEMFIETEHLELVVSALHQAAVIAGVTL